MAKKVTKATDGANSFEDALERLNKQYGTGTVLVTRTVKQKVIMMQSVQDQ